jgi:hypothetical protein
VRYGVTSNDTFTALVPKEIEENVKFIEWEDEVDGNQISRIEALKAMIRNLGLITNSKDLKDGLYEKKWRNGLRLYYAVIYKDQKKTLLILGSSKGKDQQRAIKRSRIILNSYLVIKEDIKYGPNN